MAVEPNEQGTREPVREAGAPASPSRRRFARGGAASASLIVTLASRPALAHHCTVSGMLSGPMSAPGHDNACRGLTPGFWKTHPHQWPAYVVGPCNPITGDGGRCGDYSVPTAQELEDAVDAGTLTEAEKDAYLMEPPGTRFDEVFGPGLTTMPELTLMQALWGDDVPSGGGPSPVLSHAVAALLNAHFFGEDAFGYSPNDIIQKVSFELPSDPLGLKADLEMLNERG